MKPFLPQMQTTFMKALNDANRAVRLKSADALGKLITIHMRVDPVFTELIANVKAADDSAIRWVSIAELEVLLEHELDTAFTATVLCQKLRSKQCGR